MPPRSDFVLVPFQYKCNRIVHFLLNFMFNPRMSILENSFRKKRNAGVSSFKNETDFYLLVVLWQWPRILGRGSELGCISFLLILSPRKKTLSHALNEASLSALTPKAGRKPRGHHGLAKPPSVGPPEWREEVRCQV